MEFNNLEQTVENKKKVSSTTLETLIPDFAGNWDNLQRIIDVAPEIVSHNLETVRRLAKPFEHKPNMTGVWNFYFD